MLTNVQIEQLVSQSLLTIDPFDPRRVGSNYYRLTVDAAQFLHYDEEGLLERGNVSIEVNKPYCLNSHKYVLISFKERITLGKGVFGEFFPAQFCIEQGLLLNYSRLESSHTKRIRLGIYNLRDTEFLIHSHMELARIAFSHIGKDTPIRDEPHNDESSKMIEIIRAKEKVIQELQEKLQRAKSDLNQIKNQSLVFDSE